MLSQIRRKQIEAATMIEHAMGKKNRRAFRVAPFMQAQRRAVGLEHSRSLGRDGIGMAGLNHGTREHTGASGDVTR